VRDDVEDTDGRVTVLVPVVDWVGRDKVCVDVRVAVGRVTERRRVDVWVGRVTVFVMEAVRVGIEKVRVMV